MASKRKHADEGAAKPSSFSKRKKGFSVGPANLPDGLHKRKVQKIKKDLIERAKIKKEYAKVRERELANQPTRRYRESSEDGTGQAEPDEAAPATTEPHPDRQKLLDEEDSEQPAEEVGESEARKRRRKPRPVPFAREAEGAQKRKEEAEERQRAYEEAQEERRRKIAERDRFRKAMAKARTGGRNGQRKLGRESEVLLEKVKRIMG